MENLIQIRYDDFRFLCNMAQRADLAGVDKREYNEVIRRALSAWDRHQKQAEATCQTCEGRGDVYAPSSGYADPVYAEPCPDCGGDEAASESSKAELLRIIRRGASPLSAHDMYPNHYTPGCSSCDGMGCDACAKPAA